MEIINYWDRELTIAENHRIIADRISDQLMMSLKTSQQIQNCEIDNIEIETINRCNNDCSFCPVNIHSDKRKKAVMSAELFHKIIDDLKEINYRGVISLYSNNEPLLDKRIYEFINYVNENLPDARQELYTNGLLLTPDKLEQLSTILDKLVIDIYCDENKLPDNMAWIRDHRNIKNVIAVMRNKNQILTSRAGNSPNKLSNRRYSSFCIYPFRQMIIRPDGKVSKCCHDAYGEDTLGDLNQESINEIWNGDRYKEFRANMINDGRQSINGCQKCDVLIYDCPLSFEDRQQLKSELIGVVQKKATEGRKIYISGVGKKKQDLINELEQNNIEYTILRSDTRKLFLDNNKAFLLLDYYTSEIMNEIYEAGKDENDDFVVYYRCF